MGTAVANSFKQVGEERRVAGSEKIPKNGRIPQRGTSN
jgi:hypothetical protein